MERLAEAINRRLAEEGKATLSIQRDELSGDTVLHGGVIGQRRNRALPFHDGYPHHGPRAVASSRKPSPTGTTGDTPGPERRFPGALPADRYAQFSAVAYSNAQKLAGSLADFVPDGAGKMSADELQQVRDVLQNLKPMLFCAYGETDRIVLTGTGLMGLNPADWARFASPDQLMKMRPESGKVPAKTRPRPFRKTL